MSNKPVTIWKDVGTEEAYLWKSKLKSLGIPAEVIHDNPNAYGEGAELQVRERDVQKALKIIKAFRLERKPPKVKTWDKISCFAVGSFFVLLGIYLYINTSNLAGSLFLGGFGLFFLMLYYFSRNK